MIAANTKKVEMWYEPGEIVRKTKGFECEMTIDEHAFLCGLIKEKRPSTILEIGVAEGGTTFIIDTAMKLMNQAGILISVDISPKLYWDEKRETGCVYKELCNDGWLKHSFIIGHTIGKEIENVAERMNGVIDFVVIDTTHIIPGELLDFIAVLPYLHVGTTVVLHDTMLNISRCLSNNPVYLTTGPMGASAIATKVLYTAVSGLKYSQYIEEKRHYANISAFEVTEKTREDIFDVFFSLTNTWLRIPSSDQIDEYREIIRKEYDQECNELFEYAVDINKKISKNAAIYLETGFHIPFDRLPFGSKVVIYGAGVVGKLLYTEIMKTNYCEIVLWVDKDYARIGDPVRDPNEINTTDSDYIIVAVANMEVYKEIYKSITGNNNEFKEKIIGPISY